MKIISHTAAFILGGITFGAAGAIAAVSCNYSPITAVVEVGSSINVICSKSLGNVTLQPDRRIKITQQSNAHYTVGCD